MKSESIKELATALAKAQGELHNPKFDAQNPHFKSKFASLAAVREAVIPVLAKHGLSLSQWPLAEGSYAGCRSVLAHSSGEWMEEAFLIPVDKGNAHGYASAVTYAKRLSMQAIAAVVGDEDDDGNGAVGGVNKPNGISPAAIKKDNFDALEPDEKTWLKDLADAVIMLVKNGDVKEAYENIKHELPHEAPRRHDKYVEYYTGFLSLLDSKTRSALAAYSDQLKKAA